MKQSKNLGTPNQQPQTLYAPLLSYYFGMTQHANIAFRVGSSFKKA
jgi:hypothetical protein